MVTRCWNWYLLYLGIFLSAVLGAFVQPTGEPCEGQSAVYSVGCRCESIHSNCSLPERYEGDTFFSCTVGRKSAWDGFQEKLQSQQECMKPGCEPALITSIQTYTWDHPARLLNISFSVPRASIENKFYPGAVLLNISVTVQNKTLQDEGFLSTGPIFRFFDFLKYQSTSDVRKRVISFPCILGFDGEFERDRYRVYSFSLTTFSKDNIMGVACTVAQDVVPYTTVTFNVTMYNFYFYSQDEWKTIVAVARYPTERSLYVVFEPAPTRYQVTEYKIHLLKYHNSTYKKSVSIGTVKTSTQRYTYQFWNLSGGIYRVKVTMVSESCSTNCPEHLSHMIVIEHKSPEISAKKNEAHDFPTQILFSVVGALIAVVLLLVLFILYRRRRSQPRGYDKGVDNRILLLYSNSHPTSCRVARYLVNYLREKLDMKITYDEDEIAMVTQNVSRWFTDQINSADCIIIQWPPSIVRWSVGSNRETPVQDFFWNAVNRADCVKSNSVRELKIATVYLDRRDVDNIPAQLRQISKIFHLPGELKTLYKYCIGRKPPGSVRKYLKGEEYKKSDLYKELQTMNTRLSFPMHDPPLNNIRPPTRMDTSNESIDHSSSEVEILYDSECPVHGSKHIPCHEKEMTSTEVIDKMYDINDIKRTHKPTPEKTPLLNREIFDMDDDDVDDDDDDHHHHHHYGHDDGFDQLSYMQKLRYFNFNS